MTFLPTNQAAKSMNYCIFLMQDFVSWTLSPTESFCLLPVSLATTTFEIGLIGSYEYNRDTTFSSEGFAWSTSLICSPVRKLIFMIDAVLSFCASLADEIIGVSGMAVKCVCEMCLLLGELLSIQGLGLPCIVIDVPV